MHLKIFDPNEFLYHRTVDDIFICSTDKEKLLETVITILNIFKINLEKVRTNDKELAIHCGFQHTTLLPYYGYLFHMDSGAVSGNHIFEKGYCLYSRFKEFSTAYHRVDKSVQRLMRYDCNKFYFCRLLLNRDINGNNQVFINYFEAMMLLAHKFDCLCKNKELDDKSLVNLIVETVNAFAEKAERRTNSSHKLMKQRFFVKIGYLAFSIVLKKRYVTYQDIIKTILLKYKSVTAFVPINLKKYTHNFDNIRKYIRLIISLH